MSLSAELLVTVAGTAVGFFFLYQTVVLSVYNSKRKREQSSPTKTKRPLPPLPPAGPSLADFGREAQNCRLARNQLAWAAQYGPIFSIIPPRFIPSFVVPTHVIVGDVKVAKQLLLTEAAGRNNNRFTSRDEKVAWMTRQGEGHSFTGMTEGEEWRWRKTAVLKEFHRKRLMQTNRELLPTIVETGHGLCEKLSAAAAASTDDDDDTSVPVDLLTTQVAIDVLLFFLFGRRIDFDPLVFRQSAHTMLEMVFHCATNPLYFILRYIPGTASYDMCRRRNAAWRGIDTVTRPEIQQLLLEQEEEDKTKEQSPPIFRKEGSALSSMFQTEPRFKTEGLESLIADIRVFILAGFETTAHGLSFAMGLLAIHKDLARQIAAEGTAVWDKLTSGREDQIRQALDQAPLARHFFMETVRLYPLVPTLPGSCLKDITVTSSDGQQYGLAAGTQVLFANMILNRQTAAAGSDFNPRRWEAPAEKQPYLNTFNTGTHVCPGKPLSLLEAHVFLLMAATQFEFFVPTDDNNIKDHRCPPIMDWLDHVLLKPKDGMPLRVRKRSKIEQQQQNQQ